MNYSFYPVYDTTIYEKSSIRNAGIDQILELIKNVPNIPDPEDGYYWDGVYNSRILIKFDTNEINGLINKGKIPSNSRFYLSLKGTRAVNVPISYSLDVFAVSQSWDNGRGHYNDYPEITTGTSWRYRDGYYLGDGTLWVTGSLSSGTTASYSTVAGGGTWYTGSEFYASQTFDYASTPDIRVDVSNIVRQWLSGSIDNNGFIVKKPDNIEASDDYTGNIRFFSKDTHTIYIPKLEAVWDDSVFESTSSLSEIVDDYSVYISNIKKEYRTSSKETFRVVARDRYPSLDYSNSSNYLNFKRLPTSSYYAIQDSVTDDYIIPFDTGSTRMSIDSEGNYFKIDMRTFLPERYYKIVLKVVTDGGDSEDIIDEGFYFKVVR
jgi:hypothetical protein